MIKHLKVRCGSQCHFIEFETIKGRNDLLNLTVIDRKKRLTVRLFKKEARELGELLVAVT